LINITCLPLLSEKSRTTCSDASTATTSYAGVFLHALTEVWYSLANGLCQPVLQTRILDAPFYDCKTVNATVIYSRRKNMPESLV
jgi:hypothetical protein